MHQAHKKLMDRFTMYRRWHEYSLYLQVHWGVFAAIVIGVAETFLFFGFAGPAGQAAPLGITVDGSVEYQVIEGFGAAIGADQVAAVGGSKAAVAQAAVNELGITVGRIGFEAGGSIEQCHCILDGNGVCTNQCVPQPYIHTWVFLKQNDNDDPYSADMAKFHAWVDETLDIESMDEYRKLGMTRYQLSMFESAEWLQTIDEPTSPCVPPVTNDEGGKHCLFEAAELGEHVSAFIQDIESRGFKVPWFSVVNEPEIDNNGLYSEYMIQDPIDLFADRFACRGISAGKPCTLLSTIIVGPENVSGWNAGWVPIINQSKQRISYAAFHQYENFGSLLDSNSVEGGIQNLRKVGSLCMPKMQTEFSNFYGAGGNTGIQDTYEEGFITGWHIHQGLTAANYNIWMWWSLAGAEQNIDPTAPFYYQYGPGMRLIWADPSGNLVKTPKYWAMRMFSRFVRPGMVRHDVINVPTSLRVSAYSEDGEATVVVLNTSASQESLPSITLHGITPVSGLFRYRFSEANMQEKSATRLTVNRGVLTDATAFPPYSITTYSTIDDSIPPSDVSSNGGNAGGSCAPNPGGGYNADLDCSQKIDHKDFTLILYYWKQPTAVTKWNKKADINSDGKVDLGDVGVLMSSWLKPALDPQCNAF